jgi:citrate synthase
MPKFQTAVSEVQPGRVVIRGYSHEEIMRQLDYTGGAFLTLIGRLPTAAESRLVTAILNSLLDHGFVASTVTAARYIASGNPTFVPAVAGGLLAAGANTLSPADSYELIAAARRRQAEAGLSDEETAKAVVADLRAAGQRVPGFGHPTHRDGDFRATVLFELVDELGLPCAHANLFRAIHAEFLAQTGKTGIPVNIDGCLAAIGLDLGWSVHQIVGFALLAVLPGLMAQVIEEIDSNVPLRHIDDGEYVGDDYRPLDQNMVVA